MLKAEEIFKKLGMPVNLAQCLGERAKILRDLNQPDEALKFAMEEESMCIQFGDQPGLARSWWTQGSIFEIKGDTQTQIQLWRKAIDTWKSMGMTTAEREKDLESLLEKE